MRRIIPELSLMEVRKNLQTVWESPVLAGNSHVFPHPRGLPCFPGGCASCLCHAALNLLVRPWLTAIVLVRSPPYTQHLSSKMFPRRSWMRTR